MAVLRFGRVSILADCIRSRSLRGKIIFINSASERDKQRFRWQICYHIYRRVACFNRFLWKQIRIHLFIIDVRQSTFRHHFYRFRRSSGHYHESKPFVTRIGFRNGITNFLKRGEAHWVSAKRSLGKRLNRKISDKKLIVQIHLGFN